MFICGNLNSKEIGVMLKYTVANVTTKQGLCNCYRQTIKCKKIYK